MPSQLAPLLPVGPLHRAQPAGRHKPVGLVTLSTALHLPPSLPPITGEFGKSHLRKKPYGDQCSLHFHADISKILWPFHEGLLHDLKVCTGFFQVSLSLNDVYCMLIDKFKAMLHPVACWCKLSYRNMPLKRSLAFDMLIQSVNYKPSVCSCHTLRPNVY